MALKAGYVGIKSQLMQSLRDKLLKLDGIIPAGASSENQLATNADVAGRVDWLSYALTGAKNELHINSASIPSSYASLTLVKSLNDDGELLSLSISGIASGDATLTLGELSVDKLGHIINGLDGGSSSTYEYFIRYHNADDGYLAEQDFHNGDNVLVCPPSALDNLAGITVKVRVKNGTDLTTPVVIKPMVRVPNDPDPTFAAYSMTNQELTGSVADLTGSASDQKTAINAIITAATGAADFAAFKTAMGAITPVTRSAAPDVPEETKKTTRSKKTKEE